MDQNQPHLERVRGMSLVIAHREAVTLIEGGLAELQRSNVRRRNSILFMLLLANGFERLMKTVLILYDTHANGNVPTQKQMMGWGHDLQSLCNLIGTRCFTAEYRQHSLGQSDFAYIQNDSDFAELLSILSDFAKRDRYIFLNGVADPGDLNPEWPERRWDELQTKDIPTQMFLNLANRDAARAQGIGHSVIRIERFVRALARLHVQSNIGPEARSLSTHLSHFLYLKDDDLGRTAYAGKL